MLLVVLVALGVAVMPATSFAAPAPPPEIPETPEIGSGPLIEVPAGCPSPAPATVAFVGTVLDKDGFIEKGTVRFQIDQVRAGKASPYSVKGIIDVRFGPDSQYLEIDEQYLVAAAVDPEIGALASKVSPEAPLFGGDAVVGLEDTETVCPLIDDPVQTINLDGTPVETGLLTPFLEDRTLLLATIGVPAAIVGAVLVGLVLLRRAIDYGFRGILALGRAAVSPSRDHRAARVREHANELTADRSEWGNGKITTDELLGRARAERDADDASDEADASGRVDASIS